MHTENQSSIYLGSGEEVLYSVGVFVVVPEGLFFLSQNSLCYHVLTSTSSRNYNQKALNVQRRKKAPFILSVAHILLILSLTSLLAKPS